MDILFALLFLISLLCIPVFIIWALINYLRKQPAKKRLIAAGISFLVCAVSVAGVGMTAETTTKETEELAETSGNEVSLEEREKLQAEALATAEQKMNEEIASKEEEIKRLTEELADKEEKLKETEEKAKEAEEKAARETEENEAKEAEKIAAKEAEEKAAKEAEEKAAKEAEEKAARETEENEAKEAEKIAAKETEEKAAKEAEEKAAKEAEEKAAREAEEKAAKEAEEKAVKEAEQKTAKKKEEANTEAASTSADPAALADNTAVPNTTPASSGNGDNFNTYDNASQQQTEAAYVLNTSSHKIHYPSCRSVPKIAPENYATSNSSLDE